MEISGCRANSILPAWGEPWRKALESRRIRSLCVCGVLTLLACFGRGQTSAQDTAAEEAARRAMVIAQLPPDAAKVLFGRERTPAAGPPQAIGFLSAAVYAAPSHCRPTGRTGRSCARHATAPGGTQS